MGLRASYFNQSLSKSGKPIGSYRVIQGDSVEPPGNCGAKVGFWRARSQYGSPIAMVFRVDALARIMGMHLTPPDCKIAL